MEEALRQRIRRRRQQRVPWELVAIVVPAKEGLVPGLLVEPVDGERAAIDQGIRQHQPARAVPVAGMPEEGIASHQDREHPGLGTLQYAHGSGSLLRMSW